MNNGLAETLEAIRTALRRGDYAALGDLAVDLDAAVGDAGGLVAADLHDLRHSAAQTAACLSAARNGLRAARRRVNEVANGPDGLSTYDRNGHRSAPARGGAAPKRL